MLDAFRPVVLAPAGAAGAGAGGAVAGPEPLVRFALVRSYANARLSHGACPNPTLTYLTLPYPTLPQPCSSGGLACRGTGRGCLRMHSTLSRPEVGSRSCRMASTRVFGCCGGAATCRAAVSQLATQLDVHTDGKLQPCPQVFRLGLTNRAGACAGARGSEGSSHGGLEYGGSYDGGPRYRGSGSGDGGSYGRSGGGRGRKGDVVADGGEAGQAGPGEIWSFRNATLDIGALDVQARPCDSLPGCNQTPALLVMGLRCRTRWASARWTCRRSPRLSSCFSAALFSALYLIALLLLIPSELLCHVGLCRAALLKMHSARSQTAETC